MRLNRYVTLFMTAILVVVGVGRLAAHHGWTGYDESKPLTLTGSVKAAGYENPHSFVDLQAGEKLWRVVLAPPARMGSRGISREMLKVGEMATVVGYQNKSDAKELRAERITIGGKTAELR
jgi:Family of unknown function (DUF6152)